MRLIKDKWILFTTLSFVLIISLICIYLLLHNDIMFNVMWGDMHLQHAFYMNYFRENFYYSKDLLPDLNMNLGLMQNFATMYYYGVFNIFIRLYTFFPMLDAYQYQFIFNIITYGLAFYLMCKLLMYFELEKKFIVLGGVLAAISPALTWFFAIHTVTGYPYILYILNLIGIVKLVKDNKMTLFVISNVLIITTNLFQMPAVGLFSLVFYIFYTLYINADRKKVLHSLKTIFISYLFVIGICAIIILPQLYLFKSGARYSLNEFDLPSLINLRNLKDSIIMYFKFGFGYLSAFLLTAFVFTKKRYIIIPMLLMLLIFISYDINYIFNLFSLEDKLYLYSSPVIIILILLSIKIIKTYDLKWRISITLISLLFFIVLALSFSYGRDFYFSHNHYSMKFNDLRNICYVIMVGTSFIVYLLLMINLNRRFINILYFSTLSLYVVTSFSYNVIVSTKSFVYSYDNSYKIDRDNNASLAMYRDNYPGMDDKVNFSVNRNTVYTYTSFINPYYYDYFFEYVDIPHSSGGIAVNSFRTSDIVNRVLSIESETTTKPIIYGSYVTIDFDKWLEVDRSLRLVSSLEAPAVSDLNSDLNKDIEIIDKLELVEEYDSYTIPGSQTTSLPHLNNKNGQYIIVADVDTSNQVAIFANHLRNEKTVDSSRYYNHNEVFTYYTRAIEEGISFYSVYGDATLTNMKIYFISDEDINNYENEYVYPANMEVDYNDGFTFDIDMKNQGVLATTIPYDDGYKIFVDGKEVEIILVDGSFIGAEIDEGQHDVEIAYVTPWKNIGIIVSVSSIIVFIIFVVKRRM